MKRFFSRLASVLAACALLLGMAAPSFAAETTSGQLFEFLTQENPDYAEVTALEDDILKELRLAVGYSGEEDIPDDLTGYYANAYKVYRDTQILQMDTAGEEELRAALEEGPYSWVIPFPHLHGSSYNVPVSWDGETWTVGAGQEYQEDSPLPYAEAASQRIDRLPQGNYTAVLVDGLTHIQQPVSVVFENGEAQYFIEAQYPLYLEGSEEEKQALVAPGFSLDDGIFQYDKIAQVARNMPPPNPELMGGPILDASYLDSSSTSNQMEWVLPVGLGLAGILVIALIVAVVVRRRRAA